jgi:crotonobetainyl-CoA:carnitine CoA-transferase CaiB-like acyl-CoA transferase
MAPDTGYRTAPGRITALVMMAVEPGWVSIPQPDRAYARPLPAPPLAGVRVVEAGRFASAPACATILADWGAQVVKVEPLEGDPARRPGSFPGGPDDVGVPANPRFEIHNRSRLSLPIDLTKPRGRQVLHQLLECADVFVTNVRPSALERLQIDPASVRREHARLIYAQVTGYGLDSEAADIRSYDHGAFWSASGMAAALSGPDGVPPQPVAGMGDRAAGSMLAGAVAAALFARERTGVGAHIATSLLSTGVWLLGSEAADVLRSPQRAGNNDRATAKLPTVNCFQTAEGKWLWLQVMEPDKDWWPLLEALDARWLDDDPRFSSGEPAKLVRSAAALIEALDEIFRQRSLDQWCSRLVRHDITFARVRSLTDAMSDPMTADSGAFLTSARAGIAFPTVNSPCQFRDCPPNPPTPAPDIGEGADHVLAELGLTPSQIASLRSEGVVGEADHQAAAG